MESRIGLNFYIFVLLHYLFLFIFFLPLVFITLLNVYSLKATTMFINITSVIKVLALLFITVLGIWQLIKGGKDYS